MRKRVALGFGASSRAAPWPVDLRMVLRRAPIPVRTHGGPDTALSPPCEGRGVTPSERSLTASLLGGCQRPADEPLTGTLR